MWWFKLVWHVKWITIQLGVGVYKLYFWWELSCLQKSLDGSFFSSWLFIMHIKVTFISAPLLLVVTNKALYCCCSISVIYCLRVKLCFIQPVCCFCFKQMFKVPLLWVVKGSYFDFGESPTTGWQGCKVKKHFHCLIIYIYLYLPCSLTPKRFAQRYISHRMFSFT